MLAGALCIGTGARYPHDRRGLVIALALAHLPVE